MGHTPLAISLLVCVLSLQSAAAEHVTRTRWFFSFGPSAIFLSNAAHDDLAGVSAPAGTGRGGSAQLGFEVTSHFAMRLAVHSARHSVAGPGTGGTASAAVDFVGIQKYGAIAPFLFGRVGKQAFVLSNARTTTSAPPRDHSWNGHLLGGGTGVRLYLTRRLSVAPEASLCWVRYNKVMSTDGTGTQLPLDPISGTTGSVSLLLSIHW